MSAYPLMLIVFLIATALGPILLYLYLALLPDDEHHLDESFSPGEG